jgi:hypothetical protein
LAGAGQTFKKALDQATDKVGQAGPNRELIHLIPLGAGLLALLSSFLPYYTVSVSFLGFNQTMTASAWGGGSGWVGALLTLVGGVAVSVRTLFGKSISLTQAAVAQARAIGLVALVLAWLLVLISMFGWAGSGLDAYSDFVSTGRGIGFWLTWLFTTVAVVTAALIWRSSRAQGAVPAAGSSAPVALPPSGQTSPAGPGPVAPGQAGPGQTGPWSDPTTQAAPPWSPPPAGPPQPPASPTSWPSQPAGPPTAGPPQPPGPPIG